ncbi:DUF2793 domain-containing protein [Nitratireductor sp. CAU 1489]|uniref:DUF2793 domain-containing protein n=1 Tax=Nitratireductor arenosus TaxID=2682096 RepID=A0A844QJW8_9HYPH|nr:DUF2793 domain-containing protein [Nitratireductor arenosus]MVB00177.1 DUF2793 domain-containing protein [Nitratireductor arenosus]
MDKTANLSLPVIAPAQAQKHVTHNEALRVLDAVVQLAVIDRDLTAPPGGAADGDRYIVASAATGDWAGQEGRIAAFQDGAWAFYQPGEGWLAFVADEALLCYWTGAAWADVAGAITTLQNLVLLGLGTTADAANPFSAKLNKALWTARPAAEGGDGDLRYALNKESEADVLSLLMQSNWSGRAELGLVGDDDLSVRVSPDGAAWTEILRGDRAAGEAVIGHLRVGRDMVQNVLPDSGRFNGNANNTAFSGIAYAAPTYLSPTSGAGLAAHAKFIHNNDDYGGAAGALDAEVKALVEAIRPPGARRFGPEWYVIEVTQKASGTMSEAVDIGGTLYGLAFTTLFTALPTRLTFAYHVKVKTGTAALTLDSGRVVRASRDGAAQPKAAQTIDNADGWTHICVHNVPNQYGYAYDLAQLKLPLSGAVWIALPKIVFGHVELDPELGVLMNARMFG